MKKKSTTDDMRRLTFVESLYKELRLEAKSAMAERDSTTLKAAIYLDDGATESEAVELLIIDGVSRDSAESYIQLAEASHISLDGQHEYSFQFEDIYGKTWSSYDINQVITLNSSFDNLFNIFNHIWIF